MKTEPNQLAYPSHNNMAIELGLTKREYFAAMALTGVIDKLPEIGRSDDMVSAAFTAVKMADALIAELNAERE